MDTSIRYSRKHSLRDNMVHRQPLKIIVDLGSISFFNVESGCEYTMSFHKDEIFVQKCIVYSIGLFMYYSFKFGMFTCIDRGKEVKIQTTDINTGVRL